MRSPATATALGLLAAAAVAGCGGGDKESSATATAARTQPARAPATPDGLEAIVKRCGLSPLRSPTPDAVPAEFKPEHTRVVVVKKTGEGFTATLIYDQSVSEAYKTLQQQLTAAGYAVRRQENEGRDAELFLERDGRPAEVRLSTARACANASQAVVATGSAGGEAEGWASLRVPMASAVPKAISPRPARMSAMRVTRSPMTRCASAVPPAKLLTHVRLPSP